MQDVRRLTAQDIGRLTACSSLQRFSNFQPRSIFGFYKNISENQLMVMCIVFLPQIVGGMCSASEHNHPAEDPNYTIAMSEK